MIHRRHYTNAVQASQGHRTGTLASQQDSGVPPAAGHHGHMERELKQGQEKTKKSGRVWRGRKGKKREEKGSRRKRGEEGQGHFLMKKVTISN